MKREFVVATVLLALTACSGASSVRYKLEMPSVTDSTKIMTLTQQSMRVIQRRLQSMGEEPTIEVEAGSSTGSVIVVVDTATKEALDMLTTDLNEKFDFQIMAQAEAGQKVDIEVEGHGGFVATGITGNDLSWVEGGLESERSDLGMVKLEFTPEGRTKMADLFKRMNGKNIGIFVRGQLVSKLQVETSELRDDIIIRQIPSVELAEAFADDVNVGIHVTFTPLP